MFSQSIWNYTNRIHCEAPANRLKPHNNVLLLLATASESVEILLPGDTNGVLLTVLEVIVAFLCPDSLGTNVEKVGDFDTILHVGCTG